MESIPTGSDKEYDKVSDKSPEPDDLWMHRSDEMRCYSCMHYNNFRCRKHAPTLNGWPAVYTRDWCGDHKLDKERMRGI